MSPSEFAQKIKQKYPQYASIPDEELAQKIVKKHPQYASQVQFGKQDSFLGGLYDETVGPLVDMGKELGRSVTSVGPQDVAPPRALGSNVDRETLNRLHLPGRVRGQNAEARGLTAPSLPEAVATSLVEHPGRQGEKILDASARSNAGDPTARWEIPLRVLGMVPGPGTATENAAEAAAEGRPREALGRGTGAVAQVFAPDMIKVAAQEGPAIARLGAGRAQALGRQALQTGKDVVKQTPKGLPRTPGDFAAAGAGGMVAGPKGAGAGLMAKRLGEGYSKVRADRAARTASQGAEAEKLAAQNIGAGDRAIQTAEKLRAARQTAALKPVAQALPNRAPLRSLPPSKPSTPPRSLPEANRMAAPPTEWDQAPIMTGRGVTEPSPAPRQIPPSGSRYEPSEWDSAGPIKTTPYTPEPLPPPPPPHELPHTVMTPEVLEAMRRDATLGTPSAAGFLPEEGSVSTSLPPLPQIGKPQAPPPRPPNFSPERVSEARETIRPRTWEERPFKPREPLPLPQRQALKGAEPYRDVEAQALRALRELEGKGRGGGMPTKGGPVSPPTSGSAPQSSSAGFSDNGPEYVNDTVKASFEKVRSGLQQGLRPKSTPFGTEIMEFPDGSKAVSYVDPATGRPSAGALIGPDGVVTDVAGSSRMASGRVLKTLQSVGAKPPVPGAMSQDSLKVTQKRGL